MRSEGLLPQADLWEGEKRYENVFPPPTNRPGNEASCDFVYPHVFSLTVATVDAKRGYVGMCNGRSAQQESGAALSKNSMFTAGAKNYIQLLY